MYEKTTQLKRQLKSLSESTESIGFISAKLDEYECKRQKKDKLISDMKTDMSIIKENIQNLEGKVDKQKQYSCRSCLLLHSVAENEGENIDDLALKTVNEKMNIELSFSDLDGTHRTGWKKESYRKPRAVSVKFVSYNTRKQIFSNKKQLKRTGTSITET